MVINMGRITVNNKPKQGTDRSFHSNLELDSQGFQHYCLFCYNGIWRFLKITWFAKNCDIKRLVFVEEEGIKVRIKVSVTITNNRGIPIVISKCNYHNLKCIYPLINDDNTHPNVAFHILRNFTVFSMPFVFYFALLFVEPLILNQRTKEYTPNSRTAHQGDTQQHLPRLCRTITFLPLLGFLVPQSPT